MYRIVYFSTSVQFFREDQFRYSSDVCVCSNFQRPGSRNRVVPTCPRNGCQKLPTWIMIRFLLGLNLQNKGFGPRMSPKVDKSPSWRLRRERYVKFSIWKSDEVLQKNVQAFCHTDESPVNLMKCQTLRIESFRWSRSTWEWKGLLTATASSFALWRVGKSQLIL